MVCEYCDKTFSQKSSNLITSSTYLLKNVLALRGITKQKFNCQVVSKDFTQKITCKTHENIVY